MLSSAWHKFFSLNTKWSLLYTVIIFNERFFPFVCLCLHLGRESRLPLTIKGEGMGPNLQLNYHLMNMKNVFVGDKDYYEVRKLAKVDSCVPWGNYQLGEASDVGSLMCTVQIEKLWI